MIVTHGSNVYNVDTSDCKTIEDVVVKLNELTHVPVPKIKLIGNGKVLSKQDAVDTTLADNKITKLIMMGRADAMENRYNPRIKDDLTLNGLAHRRKYEVSVKNAKKAKTSQSQYRFHEIQVIPGLENEHKATEILSLLANDPGILAVMEKHKWSVGSLCELYPEGFVGVSDICVMGLNENKGQRILLRLRTDDMKGFRKILSIKKVLYHELAHNEHSEHDDDFYRLMRQIESEAGEMDWNNTRSHKLSHFQSVYRPDSDTVSISSRELNMNAKESRKLGGVSKINLSVGEAVREAIQQRYEYELQGNGTPRFINMMDSIDLYDRECDRASKEKADEDEIKMSDCCCSSSASTDGEKYKHCVPVPIIQNFENEEATAEMYNDMCVEIQGVEGLSSFSSECSDANALNKHLYESPLNRLATRNGSFTFTPTTTAVRFFGSDYNPQSSGMVHIQNNDNCATEGNGHASAPDDKPVRVRGISEQVVASEIELNLESDASVVDASAPSLRHLPSTSTFIEDVIDIETIDTSTSYAAADGCEDKGMEPQTDASPTETGGDSNSSERNSSSTPVVDVMTPIDDTIASYLSVSEGASVEKILALRNELEVISTSLSTQDLYESLVFIRNIIDRAEDPSKRSINRLNKTFQRLVESRSALQFLTEVGFSSDVTQNSLILSRYDPALLYIAKSLVEVAVDLLATHQHK